MKKLLLILFLGILSVKCWGQTITEGLSVCRAIAKENSYSGVVCQKAVSDSIYFSPIAATLCMKILEIGDNSYGALACVQLTSDKIFEPEAEEICSKVIEVNSYEAVRCAQSATGKTFREGELDLCKDIVEEGSNIYNATNCIGNSGIRLPSFSEIYYCPTVHEILEQLYIIEIKVLRNRTLSGLHHIDRLITDLQYCETL